MLGWTLNSVTGVLLWREGYGDPQTQMKEAWENVSRDWRGAATN